MWSHILLYNHYIDFFGAIYIMLLHCKLCFFTSSLSSQREPQGKTNQGIAQNFFIHVILIYGRKGYPVTLILEVFLSLTITRYVVFSV